MQFVPEYILKVVLNETNRAETTNLLIIDKSTNNNWKLFD